MLELDSHFITIKSPSGKNHRWMLNLGALGTALRGEAEYVHAFKVCPHILSIIH